MFTSQQAIVNEILNNGLILDRGYTGHEHLWAVGIINMNGRLYDPALKRFLSPDNFIQDPYNTQNFDRYGYVLNNPLIYTDPSGEIIFGILAGAFIASAGGFSGVTIIGMITILATAAILDTMLINAIQGNPLHWSIGKSVVFSIASAGISYGVTSAFSSIKNSLFKAGTWLGDNYKKLSTAFSSLKDGNLLEKVIHGALKSAKDDYTRNILSFDFQKGITLNFRINQEKWKSIGLAAAVGGSDVLLDTGLNEINSDFFNNKEDDKGVKKFFSNFLKSGLNGYKNNLINSNKPFENIQIASFGNGIININTNMFRENFPDLSTLVQQVKFGY